MKKILLALSMLGLFFNSQAQETKANVTKKRLVIGNGEILIEDDVEVQTKTKSRVKLKYGMLDLGFTFMNDQTNYSNPNTLAFLNVPTDYQNENVFAMQTGKSINVNIWPLLVKGRLVDNERQKIDINSGIGLQVYNLRLNKNITFNNDTKPELTLDNSYEMSKNKLAIMYTSIPLMVNFKTKMSEKLWLTYGVGVVGGVNVDTWTKQVSKQHGKQKNHDMFNTNPFQLSFTAEIGLVSYIRFYGSYQLTNLYKDALHQQPIVFGIRFLGI